MGPSDSNMNEVIEPCKGSVWHYHSAASNSENLPTFHQPAAASRPDNFTSQEPRGAQITLEDRNTLDNGDDNLKDQKGHLKPSTENLVAENARMKEKIEELQDKSNENEGLKEVIKKFARKGQDIATRRRRPL